MTRILLLTVDRRLRDVECFRERHLLHAARLHDGADLVGDADHRGTLENATHKEKSTRG